MSASPLGPNETTDAVVHLRGGAMTAALDRSWPWLFGLTLVWSGLEVIERLLLRRGNMSMWSIGHVFWQVPLVCIPAILCAHVWLITALGWAVYRRSTARWLPGLLLVTALLPLYVPGWLWEMFS